MIYHILFIGFMSLINTGRSNRLGAQKAAEVFDQLAIGSS